MYESTKICERNETDNLMRQVFMTLGFKKFTFYK